MNNTMNFRIRKLIFRTGTLKTKSYLIKNIQDWTTEVTFKFSKV